MIIQDAVECLSNTDFIDQVHHRLAEQALYRVNNLGSPTRAPSNEREQKRRRLMQAPGILVLNGNLLEAWGRSDVLQEPLHNLVHTIWFCFRDGPVGVCRHWAEACGILHITSRGPSGDILIITRTGKAGLGAAGFYHQEGNRIIPVRGTSIRIDTQ